MASDIDLAQADSVVFSDASAALTIAGVVVLFVLLAAVFIRKTLRREPEPYQYEHESRHHPNLPLYVGCWALACTLPLLGLFLFVEALVHRVVVTPTSVYQTPGYWFRPEQNGFEYVEVRLVQPRLDGDRWEVHYIDNQVWTIHPRRLWKRNAAEIRQLLVQHGVEFEDAAE